MKENFVVHAIVHHQNDNHQSEQQDFECEETQPQVSNSKKGLAKLASIDEILEFEQELADLEKNISNIEINQRNEQS